MPEQQTQTEERRVLAASNIEVRADGEKNRIAGYAAVFDSQSEDLGGFREIIKRNAFKAALEEKQPVSARIQHEGGLTTIGTTESGTLRLKEDGHGLYYEIDVPDTSAGRDIMTLVRSGIINKSSFAFTVRPDGEAWDLGGDYPIRQLTNLNLHDVAPVDGPAYQATSVSVRDKAQAMIEAARADKEHQVEIPEARVKTIQDSYYESMRAQFPEVRRKPI